MNNSDGDPKKNPTGRQDETRDETDFEGENETTSFCIEAYYKVELRRTQK